MKTEHYPAVILGATARGCGLAARHPGSLILEPDILAGSNWALTFDPGRNWGKTAPEQPEARRLLEELVRRRAVAGDALNNAAFVPVFSRLCLDEGWNIALDSRVTAIEKDTIQYIDVEGVHCISADRVIDARPRYGADKYLSALLKTDGRVEPETFGTAGLLPRSAEEAVLLLPVPVETEWPEARRRFREFWEDRPAALRDAKVLLTAVRFAECRFDNPVAELEAGMREATI